MNKLTFALLTISALSIATYSHAQSDADMKAMMAYSTPGDIHKMMAKSVGTWTCAITMWMAPNTQPMNSTGEMKNEMILGGRYLKGTNTGNFMGQPFEGISTTAYDNAKKIFLNNWIDNMGTGMMNLTGTWDAATNSITFTGTMLDPASGKDIPVREVLKFVDDNHQTMEMYANAATGGQEFKTMEIKFTRK
ncbi:DUF1579 domain-containing protein [Flavitalea sp. BT771]|uniref:DUF1579 domain-containing protein n=1 Tax=Flavitalea sp. BT771 TaxID=3063329 RepID=UPI0026E35F12|nr:DUF1579 domain-containing protein [Flavitalea sp. BT771]MDO6430722.1 DUF1579 domain-containing protein [Flavitalea sp. BT771]MDV6219138.1 DUF1579 domain-containing protein [Flavitalea sp. BT771]